MKLKYLLFLLSALLSGIPAIAAAPPQTQNVRVQPVRFSSEGPAVWTGRGLGYALRLTDGLSEVAVSQGHRAATVGMKFVNALPGRFSGEQPSGALLHRLVGASPADWQTGKPLYNRVRRNNLYKGIDVVYYGTGEQLEYDLEVAPGASPDAIQLEFTGIRGFGKAADGSLTLQTAAGSMRWRAPVAYQVIGGTRKLVDVAYASVGQNRIGFRVGAWDHSRPLIIDPVFEFSRLFGGENTEALRDLYVDAAGNAYLAGFTFSQGYPATNGVGVANAGGIDMYVTKVSPTGDIVWSSVIGGSATDAAFGITVDGGGNVYVCGQTSSPDFPLVTGKTPAADFDAFVMKIAADGSRILMNRVIGGSADDQFRAVRVAAADGSIWAAGETSSADFPVTAAIRSTAAGSEGLVVKLSSTGVPSVATFIGGSGSDSIRGLALNSAGEAWFLANTTSSDMSSVGLRSSYAGNGDCYLGRITAAGTALLYGSYFGGTGTESCTGLALDTAGRPVVAGGTSSPDFPVVAAIQGTWGGGAQDGFVAKVASTGTSFVFSTFVGNTRNDSISKVALDPQNNIYVVGTTGGRLPVVSAVRPRKAGGGDAMFRGNITNGSFGIADAGIADDSILGVVRDLAGTQALAWSSTTLYRSSNSGGSWVAGSTGLAGTVREITAGAANTWFAVTSTGIFRSVDGGVNWAKIADGAFRSIAVDASNTQIAVAGADNGTLWRSVNAGAAWTQIGTAAAAVRSVAIDPRGNGVVLAVSAGNIYRWTPGNALQSVMGAADSTWQQVVFAASNPDIAYAFTGSDVYRSSNNGATFTVRQPAPATFATAYAVDPGNPDVVLVGSEWQGMFKSTDGAQTWAAFSQSYGDTAITRIAVLSGGVVVASVQNRPDAFAAKLIPDGSTFGYLTYIGSNWDDAGNAVAAGPGGAWFAGDAYETFPVNATQQYAPARRVDTFLVKLNEVTPTCLYELQATNAVLLSKPSVFGLNILAGSSCNWTVSTDANWLSFVSPQSGTGTGSVFIATSPNPGGGSRTATLTVGNTSLKVSQEGSGCSYQLSSTPTIPAAGGDVTLPLVATGACTWTVTSDVDWVQPKSPVSGTGSGSVVVTATPNTGGVRNGTIRIGASAFGLTQTGGACVVTADRTSDTAAAGGSSSQLGVSSGTGCNWNVSSSASWLTITNGASHTGSSAVAWTAAANTASTGRSATITIGQNVVTVSQPAAQVQGCTFTPELTSLTTGNSLLNSTFVLHASSQTCSWTLSSGVKWLAVSPQSGTGTTTITYNVYPNLTPRSRTTNISGPGVSIPVSQAGLTLSADERFVALMYFSFFGRMPAPWEIALQVNALHNGVFTKEAFVNNLYSSPEFNQSGRFIAGLYLGILGRDAEFAGWLFQRNAMSTGQVGPQTLTQNFLISEEYGLKYGSPTPTAFVQLLYQNVLLRQGGTKEVADWVSTMPPNERRDVAAAFLLSQEFQSKLGPRMTAFVLYATLLARDATPSEFNSLVNTVTANPGAVTSIISTMLNSAEFTAQYQ